jgi:hypothetical protein
MGEQLARALKGLCLFVTLTILGGCAIDETRDRISESNHQASGEQNDHRPTREGKLQIHLVPKVSAAKRDAVGGIGMPVAELYLDGQYVGDIREHHLLELTATQHRIRVVHKGDELVNRQILILPEGPQQTLYIPLPMGEPAPTKN